MRVKVRVLDEDAVNIVAREEEQASVGIASEIINVSTNNYEELINKPQINGVTLTGNKSSAELNIKEDLTYVYTQAVPAATWTINHNLGKYPSVTIVDSANNIVVGECQYANENTVVCTFSGQFSGKAFLN